MRDSKQIAKDLFLCPPGLERLLTGGFPPNFLLCY